MKNLNKTTTVKLAAFSILSAIIAVSMTSNSDAFAMHDTWQYWSSSSQQYECNSNLTNLDTTSNVSVCGDLYPSAQRWNAVSNSNWSLTFTTGNAIDVAATNQGFPGPLATTYTLGFPVLFSSWIDVNTEYTLGDYAQDSGTIYDYESLMTHEFGHLLKLVHNTSTSSTMYESLPPDTNRRSLDSHDNTVVAGKY